jgi:hypothetical protein
MAVYYRYGFLIEELGAGNWRAYRNQAAMDRDNPSYVGPSLADVEGRIRAGHDFGASRPPEKDVATDLYKTLVEHTIDDISYEQMSRIAHRLSRIGQSDRNSPVRVGQVLADELGEEKALSYVDKAVENGMIKFADYEKIRAAILLRMKRTSIPQARAALGINELRQGQKRLQQDLNKVRQLGIKSLEKPMTDLNKDIQRIRRSWGV